MAVRIYPAAEARILEIWDYTVKKWGDEKADTYVRDLVGVIHAASTQKRKWKRVEDKNLPGVFYLRYRQHYIFFRILSPNTLGVISILHEKMDLPSRLKEDAESEEKD